MSNSKCVASGFRTDCKKLIDQFEECDTVRFQDFSNIWQEMKFSAIFTGRPTFAEMLEFCEEVLQIAKLYMLPPNRFKTQIGGLYLLYGLYYKIPFENIKIRVTLSEWKEILELHSNIRDDNHTDANYILSKMIYDDVFHYCAFHSEYGLERSLRLREKQPVNYYSLFPTMKDMAEPGEVLSKIQNLSKLYHQAKCRISKSNEPSKSLNLYDTRVAEELIKQIKHSDDQRQNPLNQSSNEEKPGKESLAKKNKPHNSQEKAGIQLKNTQDKIRTKLGRGFDSDSSEEDELEMNLLDGYDPDLPDRFDDSSD